MASLSAALSLAGVWVANKAGWQASTTQQATEEGAARDEGTVGIGDTANTAHVASLPVPFEWSPMGVDLSLKPLPGQVRPDANGRCPYRHAVPINGGCWKKTAEPPEDCDEASYAYKGACYLPVFPRPRPPTSGPSDAPDGGVP
jgi:serine/threonine-protein kinase